MTTYATMKTRIGDEIARDDLASQIASAIQTAIAVWAPERFSFNTKRFRLVTVADQEYYSIPSALTNTDATSIATGEDIIEIDSFTLTYNDQPYRLDDRTQQWIDDEQSPAAIYTGQPDSYGWYEGKIRLFPIPDAVYTCTISAHAELSTLSDDADTNAWMVQGEALIRNQAKLIIYRDVTRDARGMELAQMGIAEALGPLKRRMTAKANTGSIRPWCL